jgi:PIN domain nuclease of toxin-antitoxin system
MSFEIRADGVNVEEVMSAIRKRIDEKKLRLYTDDEVRDIAERRLDAVLDAHEFNADFASEFRARTKQWSFSFGFAACFSLFRSSSGTLTR